MGPVVLSPDNTLSGYSEVFFQRTLGNDTWHITLPSMLLQMLIHFFE